MNKAIWNSGSVVLLLSCKMRNNWKSIWFTLLLVVSFSNLNAQTEKVQYSKALDLLEHNDFKEAKSAFFKLTQTYPNNAQYHHYLGVTKLELADPSSALVDLNKCISIDPNIKEAYFNRYVANNATRNFQFALADISKYIEFYPNDTLSRLNRFALSKYMNEVEESIQDGKWLLTHNVGGDSLIHSLILLLTNEKRDIDLKAFLDQVIVENRDNHWWYFERAMVSYRLNQFEFSLKDLNRFLMVEPKYIPALKLRFDNNFYLRNLPLCEKQILELIYLDPKNGTFQGDYGHILLQKGDWNNAIKSFNSAIKNKGEHLGYVYLGRGIARYNLGDIKMACEDWEKSLLLGEITARRFISKYCD